MKTNYIKFRISDSMKEELMRIAEKNEMNQSELMMYLVREEIKRNRKESKHTYASLDFLYEKEKEQLFNCANSCNDDEFELFVNECNSESWIYRFTDALDDECEIPESDRKVIDEMLKMAWEEARKHRYSLECIIDSEIYESYTTYYSTIEDLKQYCKNDSIKYEIDEFYVVNMHSGEKMDELTDEVNEYVKNAKWELIASYMDDEIREKVHNELAPCSRKAFFERYMELDSNFSELLDSEFSDYDMDFILS